MRISLLLWMFCCCSLAYAVSPGSSPAARFFAPAAPTGDSLPVITCPAKMVIYLPVSNCTQVVTYTVTASDDTPGWTLSQTSGLASGSAFPIGTTTNLFQVTDTDGNTATCTFKVSVYDTIRPVLQCPSNVTVSLLGEDENDCFDGSVAWVNVNTFGVTASDNCGTVHLTVRRKLPFTDCILSLNSVNGFPDCNDLFPDFPSEFERAISEADSMKFYCCENQLTQTVIVRGYQLNAAGQFVIGPTGFPIYGECTTTVTVSNTTCPPAPYRLSGSIELDVDHDCTVDETQFEIPLMNLVAVGPGGQTLYATSDASGFFNFGVVDSGSYVVTVIPASPAWQICNNPKTMASVQGVLIGGPEFAAQIETECPVLYTDLSSTNMRPCSTSVLNIRTCNIGGDAATDAYAEVSVDATLTVTGASLPYTVNGNVVTVQLGDIPAGECNTFTISVMVPCDPSIAGDVLCSEVHLYPDSVCLPPVQPWSGAQIEARAECVGDSIRFILRNTGWAPTAAPSDYIVIDDMVIMREGQVPAGFGPGEELVEVLPTNGESARLMAQQELNHPIPVNPSVAIENCNGVTFPSQLLNFRNESGNPFTNRYCRTVTTSFDPNEKLAFPVGFSNDHLIEQNTRLTYQIGFQNTGTDTAFLVVLHDTLSALLHPATLRPGAASHPYTWKVTGEGILSVRFENILLPDSTTNEPASHGYVQFDIDQRPDNPLGSVIENRAGIYFDINPVVLTNTVFHTVGTHFVPSAVHAPGQQDLLQLYPNPATESFYLPLSSDASVQVLLRDAMGRIQQQYTARAPGLLVRRGNLPGGVYFVELQARGGERRGGVVVWK